MSSSAGNAGQIIYKAFTPTLKMALCIVAGFITTKAGMLPPSAAKGISLVTMNISLPCLIFGSMVSAFTPHNVAAMGPLVLVAVIYEILGLLCAFIVKEIAWVPKDFRWGILVMGVVSNWGNLPTAVVQTMAREPPFNPATDVDLGVAYIAIFVLVMNTTFFGLGFHKLCAWDFTDDHAAEDLLPFKQRWRARFETVQRWLGRKKPARAEDAEIALAEPAEPEASSGHLRPILEVPSVERLDYRGAESIATSATRVGTHKASDLDSNRTTIKPRKRSFTSRMEATPRIPATAPLDSQATTAAESVQLAHSDKQYTSGSVYTRTYGNEPSPATPPNRRREWGARLMKMLRNTPPPTWAVVFGLPCSLVSPLKALLTDVPGWTGSRMPNAPDGNPPLHFILETSIFIGAIAVPMALILLGASFARLTAMRKNTGLFPPQEKIRTFVAILLSGTPAAANQLVVTQIYNPAGTAHTLASFLLLQYALMFILSTGLAAIALYIVA
ncbi:putative transporter [Vanrija pseudolonga]|uniref:Purtative transporter n=1 Tax=Vanrija pseudolonga TaxID=143232 RepID=A0AAF1BH17_9TREE|nr:purtative transporter [Vanrija pseudolonga]